MRALILPLIAGLLIGCGAGDDEGAADTANQDTAATADESSESAPEKVDSIPMSVTITIPTVKESGGTFNGGTFTSQGNGARCEHIPNAPAGQMEWAVLYGGDTTQVGPVQFNVGKLENGKTTHLFVMVAAGTVEAAGMKSPLMHVISTAPPGPPQPGAGAVKGSGTVTVSREGQRVRFEVDGVSGTTMKPFKMTLVCEREGKWV